MDANEHVVVLNMRSIGLRGITKKELDEMAYLYLSSTRFVK